MARYPIYLELKDKRILLIGGGPVAFQKAQSLLDTQCRLTVVTLKACACLEAWCEQHQTELILGPYQAHYLNGALLVIAATNQRELNEQIYTDCQNRQILCNVVDKPDLCDFYVPAIVKRGELQIAISTNGASPALAGHIRKKLEQQYTEQISDFVNQLGTIRPYALEHLSDPDQKKVILGWLAGDESFDWFMTNGPDAWQTMARHKIAEAKNAS